MLIKNLTDNIKLVDEPSDSFGILAPVFLDPHE
jgi:hypothetical protein